MTIPVQVEARRRHAHTRLDDGFLDVRVTCRSCPPTRRGSTNDHAFVLLRRHRCMIPERLATLLRDGTPAAPIRVDS